MKEQKHMTGERESGVELLRILAACGVIVLHFCLTSAGGGFLYVQDRIVNKTALYFLESVNICAVNIFIIMSGYYLCLTQKRKFIKPIQLVGELMIIGATVYLYGTISSGNPISKRELLYSIMPLNYYVVLYCTLYLVSPYINILFENLDFKGRKKAVILFGILFSVWPTFVDLLQEILYREFKGLSTIGLYGSQWGYSIVNFMLLYVIGAYLRLNEVEKDGKFLRFVIALSAVILTGWAFFNESFARFSERSAWEYCNPFVIIEAVAIFLLFKQIHFSSRIINRLAKASFTCFLVHMNFVYRINAEQIVGQNVFLMLLELTLTVFGIYLITWMIHEIYTVLTKFIFVGIEKLLVKIGISEL